MPAAEKKRVDIKSSLLKHVPFRRHFGAYGEIFWRIYLLSAGLTTFIVLIVFIWSGMGTPSTGYPDNHANRLLPAIAFWLLGNLIGFFGTWLITPKIFFSDDSDGSKSELSSSTRDNPLGATVQCIDAYRKLKQTRDFLCHMFHSVNELLIVISPNGIIQSLNKRTTKTLGYLKGELIGKSIDIILIKESSPFSVNCYDDFIESKRIPYVESAFRTKKGRQIPVLFTASAIGSGESALKGIVCVGLPLKADKRAEIVMQKSDARYRNFLESIDQAYYEIDLRGQLTFFNDALCRLLGNSRESLISRNLSEFTTAEQARELNRIFQRIYHTGQPDKGFIWEFFHQDGSIRKIGASLSLMVDQDGKPYGFRGVARDITRRLVLEAQMTHARKLESIGQLAAGIAHEINTPIQYIQDNTLFLKDAYDQLITALNDTGGDNPEKQNDKRDLLDSDLESEMAYYREEIPRAIEQSLEGLDRVSQIVGAMRIFAHPGGGEKTPIDINKAIEGAITVSRNEWKYIAEMETHLDDSLPLVYCLPAEFNQVLLNLIINAAHAIAAVAENSQQKGCIAISTRSYGRWVEICISDTGSGIPKAIQSRIYDPFFTTKDVGKGTGQGLALTHSIIVNKHNGTIRFETEEGQGTRFFICLPLNDN